MAALGSPLELARALGRRIRRKRRRIPREFLLPRPMASPAHRSHWFWNLVTLQAGAVGLAGLIAASSPLRAADETVHGALLRAAGKSDAPSSVVAILIPPGHAGQADCREAMSGALVRSGIRTALLLPPADRLCSGAVEVGVPIHAFPTSAIRLDSAGRVLGFVDRTAPGGPLAKLGILRAHWVSPRVWRSVPAVSLPDLARARVPSEALRGRVALVAQEDPFHSGDVGDNVGPLSLRVAAAVGAALEDGPRRTTPWWADGLLAALFSVVFAWIRRRWRRHLPSAVILAAAVLAGVSYLGARGVGCLLPLASLGTGLAAFFGVVALPGLVAFRRARAGAAELLARAPQLGAHSAHLLSDEEFWSRLATRVSQVHPAQGVLVAELPPFNWRLKVWPNDALNESIIRERRRDIRRTPYVDEAGNRRPRVVDGFVVMPGVPTVVVPLEAADEVEGYLFLVGSSAADAFVAQPEVAKRLGTELAELIRGRRLEIFRAQQWRRPAGLFVEDPSGAAENLARARAALEELELHSRVLWSAPVGLLYTDSFGDVRILGRAAADWLKTLGVPMPELSSTGYLPPGALPFVRVLDRWAELAGIARPALAAEPGHDEELEIPLEGERLLKVRIRRLESEKGQGYVSSMVEVERPAAGPEAASIRRLPEAVDPLAVFSLSELLATIVDDIAEEARVRLRFQTPRVLGYVVAHRQQLTAAVTRFLLEVARTPAAAQSAVLTVRESLHRVELTIVHLKLGVPASAIASAALAPSVPPPGLDTLAKLVSAVEDSHGQVRVKSTQGWGLKLTASLMRARPRVHRASSGHLVHLEGLLRDKKGDTRT